jgi:hypothetical protein
MVESNAVRRNDVPDIA